MNSESFAAPPTFLKVLLGAQNQEFHINKETICLNSKFFETACAEEVALTARDTVTLADADPGIFTLFLVWLSTGTITAAENLVSVPLTGFLLSQMEFSRWRRNVQARSLDLETHTQGQAKQAIETLDCRLDQLITCHYLAVSVQSETFQNYIMDSITSFIMACNSVISRSPIPEGADSACASRMTQTRDLYEKTTETSLH
jgi:hypothetical protein